MRRTRVKICGITRPQDGISAATAGVDAIGMVFFAHSPRAVGFATAKAITSALPAWVSKVGLFVDPDAAYVRDVLAQVPLDFLQFHGSETADFCRDFQRPYIKAIRMRSGVDLMLEASRYTDASALLLDSHAEGGMGGTGLGFDWNLVPRSLTRPVILAGGLTAGNVGSAIRQVAPF
ncbi:MAG: phosphoribosylanthranilate isomerase, partial [Gammaproteobacteria bacterium]